MKRYLIVIAGALLLATAVAAVAAEKSEPFNPALYNEVTLPPGILYMDSGTIDYVEATRVVVNDADYPFHTNINVYTREGLKTDRKALKKGTKVDLYANDRHEAVYVVVK